MKKLFIISIFFLVYSFNSYADNVYFIDFTKVLNTSKPGAEAQKKLKQKVVSETKKFNTLEQDIRKKESKIISLKKEISTEDYRKKVESLRKEVGELQKNKQNSFSNIAKSRNAAKDNLIKALKPVIKNYMSENKISMVLDKKGVILGDQTLEITDQIISILNKNLPSLNIN